MTVTVSTSTCECVCVYKSPVNMTVSVNIYDCDCVYEHLWMCLHVCEYLWLWLCLRAPVNVSASTGHLWTWLQAQKVLVKLLHLLIWPMTAMVECMSSNCCQIWTVWIVILLTGRLHARQPYKEIWWHYTNGCELHDQIAMFGKIISSLQ